MTCFDTVLVNCLGGPEVVAFYQVLVSVILAGTATGFRPPETIIATHPGDVEARHCLSVPWPPLSLGDVAIVRVRTVDAADNTSDDACQ